MISAWLSLPQATLVAGEQIEGSCDARTAFSFEDCLKIVYAKLPKPSWVKMTHIRSFVTRIV